MMIIPALHDAANDQPVRYTPVCSHAAVPVCLNPAYSAYVPTVPPLSSRCSARSPGCPARPPGWARRAPTFRQISTNGISIGMGSSLVQAGQPEFRLVLPDNLPGVQHGFMTTPPVFAAEIRQGASPLIVGGVVGAGPNATPAQQAVMAGLLQAAEAGQPQVAIPPGGAMVPGQGGHRPGARRLRGGPALRCAAAATRRAWLGRHLAALQDGRITLTQLP